MKKMTKKYLYSQDSDNNFNDMKRPKDLNDLASLFLILFLGVILALVFLSLIVLGIDNIIQ